MARLAIRVFIEKLVALKQQMQVKLLDSKAKVPHKSTEFAAGYDLYALEGGTVPRMKVQEPNVACGSVLVRTGIAIALPPNTYAQIASRSSLAVKHNVHVGAGVIDQDYRGEVKVFLYNLSNTNYHFAAGERIAQLLVLPIVNPEPLIVAELTPTVRGDGGFGSTGKT